jgi:hypothetical protein
LARQIEERVRPVDRGDPEGEVIELLPEPGHDSESSHKQWGQPEHRSSRKASTQPLVKRRHRHRSN